MYIKWIARTIAIIFLIIITYIAISFTLPLFSKKYTPIKSNKIIYIYYDEVHTEIIMNTSYFYKEFSKKFPSLVKNSLGFLAFSFGDRDFFMQVPNWNDIKINITLNSLFFNTPALIRVSKFRYVNKDACKKIYMNDKNLIDLKNSILNTFNKKNSKFIHFNDHYKENGTNYYIAKQSYNLFYTCNNWTGDRLKDANITQPLLTPFAQQVIYPF